VIVMAAMAMVDSSRARPGSLGKWAGWCIPLAGPLGVAAVPAWILATLAGPIAFYVITNEGPNIASHLMTRSTNPASTVASDELIAQRDEHDGEFGDGRFGEPAAAGQGGAGVESQAESEKVRMSNTELSRPKTIMKVRMDRRFQVRGLSSCLGSTLPGQQPDSAGAGDKRLAGGLLRQEGHPWRTP
jgi:hypothetical protein